MKLGVISDCFKRPMKESIEMAASLGIDGIQMYAVSGDICPENLTKDGIAFYKKVLRDCNLSVSALCGDLGGHGFELAKDNVWKIEKTKKIVDLACDFETSVVTTHIGVIPDDVNCEKYSVMVNALRECSSYAHAHGVTLAVETGPETAPVLHRFIENVGNGLGVNLDPANFVMVTGQDPAEAVRLMGKHIVHTHMKDGKMLRRSDPVEIYGYFADGGIEALNVADFFIETPVGDGDVNWDEYIGALRSVGYNGYLTVERETGADPAADIRKAVDFAKAHGWHL